MRTLAGGALAAVIAMSAANAQTQLVSEDIMVKSPDAGIEIFVRNKRPANMTAFRPERTLVYVHGATYPASTAFDLKLGGLSWMEYIAARGYDVYLLDLRGYGKSTRPKEMSEEAAKNPPLVRGDTAVKDIGTVVDFVLARRNIPRVNLLGWSWGTTLMATYTAQNNAKVERLALYAPAWIRQTPSLVQTGPGPDAGLSHGGARRRARPLAHRRAGRQEGGADPGRLVRPVGRRHLGDRCGRREDEPAGAARAERRGAGRARFLRRRQALLRSGEDHGADPAVHAEWDRDTPPYMAQTLFPLLTNSPGKRYVELAEGTHTIIMEKNRMKLFEAVQTFLDEAGGS